MESLQPKPTDHHGRGCGDEMSQRSAGAAPVVFLVAAMLTAAALSLAAAQSELGTENYIVLRVNDRVVTLYDYQQALSARIGQVRTAVGVTDQQKQEWIEDAGRHVMKVLFEDLLLKSRADQLAIVIDASDVDEQLKATRERFGFENDAQFRQALTEQGMREEDFRAQLRTRMRSNAVLQREVALRVDLADEDLRRFYRDNEERFRVPERARFEEVVVLEGGVPAGRMAPLAALARTRLVSGKVATKVAEGLGEGVTAVDVG